MSAPERVLIGIDPGKNTGVAIYRAGDLHQLHTLSPDMLESLLVRVRPDLVVFEDSRKQSPVFSRGVSARATLKIARNVGEIDMLCRQIEEMCRRHGLASVGVSPLRKGAKVDSARFAILAGWLQRSNQHERDAAMVAHPYRRAEIGKARPTIKLGGGDALQIDDAQVVEPGGRGRYARAAREVGVRITVALAPHNRAACADPQGQN